jgi:type I restriction enzyme S subunit
MNKDKNYTSKTTSPKDSTNRPEIRFAVFTGAWEQRKLSDYLETSTEKNVDGVFTKQDVLSVSGDVGIVNQIEFKGRSFAGVSVANYGVVHTGDVVYTKSPLQFNPFGIIKTNKGRAGIVSTLYAVYHPRDNVCPDFVQTYFEQNARVNNYLHPLVNKGAKNDMKVSADNALKGFVRFPDVAEQRQISEFFAEINRLIALHQREREKLQNMKKALLEKMFV